MNRLLLPAAAVLVVLVVGLVYLLREPAPAPAPAPSASPAPATATPAPSVPAAPAASAAPSPDRDAAAPASPPGITVRDHRGDPNRIPTPPSPIASLTLAELRQAVHPQIRACATLLKDLGKPARMVVHARIHVAGGRVTVSDVTVSDPLELGEAYASCVQRAYSELTTDASGEQKDGEDLVHMPWTVP